VIALCLQKNKAETIKKIIMKTKFTLVIAMLISITILGPQKSNGQQAWILTGNNNASNNSRLGTLNNFPLRLVANGNDWMRLETDGRVNLNAQGLAPSLTKARLAINSSANQDPFRVMINGNTRFLVNEKGGVSIGTTTEGPAQGLFVNGSVGIGQAEPAVKLHVNGGTNAGLSGGGYVVIGSPASQNVAIDVNGIMSRSNVTASPLYLNEYGGNVYIDRNNTGSRLGIGITSPAAKLHIVGGTDASLTGGGYVVSGNTSADNIVIDDNEIMARNGASSDGTSILYLNNQGGDVHIGRAGKGLEANGVSGYVQFGNTSLTPAREIDLTHGTSSGAAFGLRIRNGGGNNEDWTLYTANATGDLELYGNGIRKGFFDDQSGEYTPGSDARIKKDIENVPSILEKILQLNVKKYHFLGNKAGDKKYYGMIAQEVEKIFPEVVKHINGDDGKDFYALRYNALSVLAIKAIQEQQEKINTQDTKIEELTRLVNQLLQSQTFSPTSSTQTNTVASKVITANPSLEQNSPNPFNSSTVIRYHIPASVTNAQIIIANSAGSPIKTFNLINKGAGSVTIKAGELAAGNYYYTLVVDGKKTDSKQMVLIK